MKLGSSTAAGATLGEAASERGGKPDLRQLYLEHSAFVQQAVANLAGPGLDADDLVQDVFLQVFRRWGSFEGRSSVQTWLYGVTLGVVRNARRRARFRRFLGLEAVADAPAAEPGPVELLEQSEARRTLHALLDRLPEERRTVLVLFEFEGLRGEQIAEIVGCSVQAVWNRLLKARRQLAQEHARLQQAARAGRQP